MSSAEQSLRTRLGRLPAGPGVYRFRDRNGRILYVGRATHLRSRVGSYWGELGGRRHLTAMIPHIERVEAVACDSLPEAVWLERNLLERRLPRWNRAIGGAEVPTYIRLETRPGGSTLAAVHEPIAGAGRCHFGPYLGGTKVRLAVSAVHRVFPLGYAQRRMTGTVLELARQLGIRPDRRDAMTAAITAVLKRDLEATSALWTELERRRDEAAASLAFELAGRIHAELQALAWVVAEQKVTSHEPYDMDIHGWSEGILVSFEVRSGRLNSWSQRPCSRRAAAARTANCPSTWCAFATRNAELAASLAD